MVAACLCALPAVAGASDEARWYLQIDNDVVFTTDRWYTSGVRIARVHRAGDHEIEVGLLQEIYTPEARYFEPGRTDRAPAARLLVSAARHDRSDASFQTVELTLGVRGPAALGRQTTDFVHRLIAAPEVDWSRQEPNRLDASVNAVRTLEWLHLNVHYGAVLGTELAFAHAGVELRARDGSARSIASPLLRFAATPPFAGPDREGYGWNLFVGLSGRAIARNELVSRSYEVGAAALQYTKTVARSAAGVTWSQPWGTVAFAVAQDTRDFERQRTPQKFGSLTLHVDF
ncbi:MAG: lipid A-modifier LpxR family protein [Usitatibacter sp.]